MYKSALKEYVCEAVWREAGEINLTQFALQAQVAYELVKQEVKQTRKRGQALLRKIAKDPMSILGQVQEILPVVQSQLHDYPALNAIAQAIAITEPQRTELQISPEQYQAELAQLEIAEVQRQRQRQQAIALNTQMEKLLEIWQCGGTLTEISPQILSDVTCYLETSEGKGYLGAVKLHELSNGIIRQQNTNLIQPENFYCDHPWFGVWQATLARQWLERPSSMVQQDSDECSDG